MKKANFDGFENQELIEKIKNLYEKLERDPVLEKEFLEDEKKFLENHGFNHEEVKDIIQNIQTQRMDDLAEVLKQHDEKLD